MSLGALILVQKEPKDRDVFVALEDVFKDAITEVRVEQHLDKQTSFAIRFQEDFEDDERIEGIQSYFAKSRGFAICVSQGEPNTDNPPELVCLVRGQVENVSFEVNIGGSGSSYEVRGQDTRTLINRVTKLQKAKGISAEAVAKLVAPAGSEDPDVGESIENYHQKKKIYRYRGSKLEAVYDLAKKSNFSFWLTYQVLPRADESYQIKVTPHVKPSPDRNEKPEEDAPTNLAELGLIPGQATAELRILGTEEACETVVNFNVTFDSEALVTAIGHGQDIDFGTQKTTKATSQAGPLNPDGEDAGTVGAPEAPSATDWGEPPEEKSAKVSTRGDPEVVKWQAYAAATEASWYVKGEALTSMHMLEQALAPHDIVQVIGGGCGIAGKYQVSDVTHVINPAEHWMELKLRSNSRNLQDKPPLS